MLTLFMEKKSQRVCKSNKLASIKSKLMLLIHAAEFSPPSLIRLFKLPLAFSKKLFF